MRTRRFFVLATACIGSMALAVPAFAISPHFVQAQVTNVSSNTLTVQFRESGLDHSQNSVNIAVSGVAECINPGQHHPKAANKSAEGASGTFNVSNGTASGSLTMRAANISPNCSPPMVIAWDNVVITDTTFSDSVSLGGLYCPGSSSPTSTC